MSKLFFALAFVLTISISSSEAQVNDLFKKANDMFSKKTSLKEETGNALKEALNQGVEKAVNELSAEKGYLESPYKILVPNDAQRVIDKVKLVPGFQDVEENLIDKMNAAAEIAAKKATPIFVNSIKKMTIADATNILMGEKNAATMYLDKTSRKELYTTFMPIIQSSLDEVNARTYWTSVVKAYNNIPFVKKLNPDLDDHVNNKGLDGLFSLIETKEKEIRSDQSQRNTDLLRKVFAKQD